MKLKVTIHKAEEGGYLAKVPAIQVCATQSNTFAKLFEEYLRCGGRVLVCGL